jgi:hypothetical protein
MSGLFDLVGGVTVLLAGRAACGRVWTQCTPGRSNAWLCLNW